MQAFTASTFEIDDVQAAVAEILEQLQLQSRLCQNSVGIISCYAEFIDSGVVEALCNQLPFDVVGITTIANATGAQHGRTMLTISVLTADDVYFSTSVSNSLANPAPEEAILKTYLNATSGRAEQLVAMFAFTPLLNQISGEYILDYLNEYSNGVPILGTVTVDHNPDYRQAQTIINGVGYADALVVLLLYGNVAPTYLVASISGEGAQKQKAIVTDAQGGLIKAINGLPFTEYIATLGIVAKEEDVQGLNTIPIVLDYNDGTPPTTRAIYRVTPEGYAACGGDVPINSTLALDLIDHDDVLQTAQTLTQQINALQNKCFVLLYSCIGRAHILGADVTAEAELAIAHYHNKIPYQLTYSGGEICPVQTINGQMVNRFHNFSVVACIL